MRYKCILNYGITLHCVPHSNHSMQNLFSVYSRNTNKDEILVKANTFLIAQQMQPCQHSQQGTDKLRNNPIYVLTSVVYIKAWERQHKACVRRNSLVQTNNSGNIHEFQLIQTN